MPKFYVSGYAKALAEASIEAESQEAANERMADLMTHLPEYVLDDEVSLTWLCLDDDGSDIEPCTVEDFQISSQVR